MLTTDGMDDTITPSQYGILALITALSKELEENLPIKDIKDLFSDVWDSDVKFLIDNDYLRENEDLAIIRVTPLGKAILKNIIQDLTTLIKWKKKIKRCDYFSISNINCS
ncbi:MAG: hypothetical protein ACTSR5_18865 [Promethearchaeota archaeon]